MNRLIVGNKSDQIEKRKVNYDEAYEYGMPEGDVAKSQRIDYVEVSALNASNISDAF